MRGDQEMTERDLDEVAGGCSFNFCMSPTFALSQLMAAGAAKGAASGVEPPVVLHEPATGGKGGGSGVVLY